MTHPTPTDFLRPGPCPDCGKADQVTYGPNASGIFIGCIRCQNARVGFKNVPAAIEAWNERSEA